MPTNRSRSHPVIALQDGCKLVRSNLDRLAESTAGKDRNAVARMLNYSSGSGGAAARKVAALTQYGLLDRHKGRYTLSVVGGKIRSLPISSREYADAVRVAFRHPPLFRDLLETCQKNGSLPADLRLLLETHHGITPKASGNAADVFIRSARFAGFLNSDGCLVDALGSLYGVEDSVVNRLTSAARETDSHCSESPDVLTQDRNGNKLQHEIFPIPLPESKEAVFGLGLPMEISEASVKVLRKRLNNLIDDLDDYFSVRYDVDKTLPDLDPASSVVEFATRKSRS